MNAHAIIEKNLSGVDPDESVRMDYLGDISLEIIEKFIFDDIRTFVNLLCVSKTMETLSQSYLAYNFLEKYTRNKCPRELPCATAWKLVTTLNQPNHLSKMLKCSWFYENKEIISEILDACDIVYVTPGGVGTFVEYTLDRKYFTVPDSDIDYCYTLRNDIFDGLWSGIGPTATEDAIVLLSTLNTNPSSILNYMFVESVMCMDKNKTMNTLMPLIDARNFATFSQRDEFSYRMFYDRLGLFPVVCDKIVDEFTDKPFNMLFSLKDNPRGLDIFLRKIITMNDGVHDLIDFCAEHKHVHVIGLVQSIVNIDFLLPKFYKFFFSCGSMSLRKMVLNAPELYISQKKLTADIYSCVKHSRVDELRMLLQYKAKFDAPTHVHLYFISYPSPSNCITTYNELFAILSEYAKFMICHDLESYIDRIGKNKR